MNESLAILVSIYVLYVLYQIVKVIAASDREPSQTVPAAVASPAPQPAAAGPAESAPPPAQAAAEHGRAVNLRDPASGEVSPAPNNYRFAKKWIKEALVAEGLLKKVYKNSELTDAVNAQVKEALEQFKALTQYHA